MLFKNSVRTSKRTPYFTITKIKWLMLFNPLKAKRERVRKDSIRVEVKRKYLGESERRFISEGGKEHLVGRYPGNARSSL
jgi:hypothetical protein